MAPSRSILPLIVVVISLGATNANAQVATVCSVCAKEQIIGSQDNHTAAGYILEGTYG